MSMRTAKMEKEYKAARETGNLVKIYDEVAVLDFKYWRIVKNRWPHDKIAVTNDMIVLKRECEGLMHIKFYEWFELLGIIWDIKGKYDTFTYNLPSMSSVKNIPHAHLYVLKKGLK